MVLFVQKITLNLKIKENKKIDKQKIELKSTMPHSIITRQQNKQKFEKIANHPENAFY